MTNLTRVKYETMECHNDFVYYQSLASIQEIKRKEWQENKKYQALLL